MSSPDTTPAAEDVQKPICDLCGGWQTATREEPMPADTTPLARRLIRRTCEALDVAAIATWDYQDGHGLEGYTEPLALAAVVAVLREVADELFESLLSRVEPGMVVRPAVIPNLIRGWADSIEKGGADEQR